MASIREGVALLTWEQDAFALAESYDETEGRYRGLRGGQVVTLPDANTPALLVKPSVARKQLDAERAVHEKPEPEKLEPEKLEPEKLEPEKLEGETEAITGEPPPPRLAPTAPKRFYGTVDLDPERVGRDASRIAEEVIAHLSALVGSDVKVTLEIEASLPSGAPEQVVRIVTENSVILKFESHGFEAD